MKIVCLSLSRIPSDTANSIQVMKVCQAFAQMGHDVHLLVPGPKPAGLDPEVLREHYGLRMLFKIEWLAARTRRLFPWKAVRRARSLGAQVLYAWPLQAAALGLLAGIPSMLELHDLPSGHFGALWLRFFLLIPGKKRLLPITAALQAALHLPAGLTVVVPDGVDLERYTALPDPISARRELDLPALPTVLCTGHLYQGRGVDLFLRLAAKFPQVGFIWVGGRPADVDIWRKRAGERILRNVIFIGFIPNERIPLYQFAADVLLMPYQRMVSTSSGGNTAAVCSPMKMFEYMAAGGAILTSDLPVLREVLDERTAVFCPPDDGQAWEAALGALLADEHRRKTLGRQARQLAERYTWLERGRRALDGFM